MIRIAGSAGWIAVASFVVFGQSASFEVASVKPHQGPGRIGISTSGPRLNAEACHSVKLIMYAYNLQSYQVPQTPPLLALGDEFYDIVAKAPGDVAPTVEEFRQMLQALLADRFQLKIHRETREMPVYELVVGKNGPKFKESAPDASPLPHYAANGRNWEVAIAKASMDEVVKAIDDSLPDRPVLDKTGLTGTYDIKMAYTPNIKPNRDTAPELTDIGIFTAVEQLGLKLEARKAMVEVLVVDRIEKPSQN